jgi:anthranilate/para-aminobenzoate synthase component II
MNHPLAIHVVESAARKGQLLGIALGHQAVKIE